jgi:hypothetical protein
MTLGSLLLQPKTLERMQALDANQALADDIVALLHQILVNPDHLDSVAPAFRKAFAAMGERMRGRLEPRLQSALDQLRALLAPVLQAGQDIAQKGQQPDSASAVFELVAAVLEKAAGALEALSEPQLRDLARRLNGILSDTLGLNQSLIKEEVRHVFRTVRQELLVGVGIMNPRAAGIHLALSALIGRMEQQVFDQWPALDLNPDRLAQEAFRALQRTGFEKLRAQLACILEKVRAALAAGGALIDLASPGNLGGSVGAQARAPLSGDRYCWYASWLYATRRQGSGYQLVPCYPTDEVWLSEDRRQLILRKAEGEDEVLHEVASGTIDWYDAPQFTTASGPECFTFGAVSPQFLETWTHVFAAFVEFTKGLLHIINCATSPKEYASNIPFIVWDLAKTAFVGLAEAPLPSFIAKKAGAGVGASQGLFNLLPILMVLAGSFEGMHSKTTGTNKFLQWLTLLGGDALNAYSNHAIVSTVHDALISFWTLINQTGPAGPPDGEETRPRNREYGKPLIGLVGTGANALMMKYIIPREDYAHPFEGQNVKNFLIWWLAGSTLAGVAGGLVGTLVVWTLSRTYDWKQFGEEIGLGALRSVLGFVVTQYALMEGDTDGGKYNPKLDPEGNAYSPARQPFVGYPPADTSPYKLPYERGVSMFVGQANQGFFSHMRFNSLPQVYGYDFAHDFGDEILCSRAGTVVDYFDWIPDDIDPSFAQISAAITAAGSDLVTGQTGGLNPSPGPNETAVVGKDLLPDGRQTLRFNWNFIVIRHDTRVPVHDDVVGGSPLTTFAVYGHGKQGSVREVFNARGVATANIIGTTVQQGELIMKAGDTGTSFHNHLHMHVLGAAPTTPTTPPITSYKMLQFTLPFVFREAKHVIARDGVLKNLTWYKSDNQKL